MEYTEQYENSLEYAAEPEVAMQINRELALARRIVEQTGSNLFLTGKAGTGKTTFLRRLQEDSGKRMVVLAPTGVAAINAGGMTIHSFFQLPFSPYIPGRGFAAKEKGFMRMSKEKRRMIASLDLIVIDEISMVRPDTLDGIDSILRRLRGNESPFGGVQLLLIGDLRQLAPVVGRGEGEMLKEHYPSFYFFDSHALRKAGFIAVELKHIYRQQNPEFISLLNAIRDGHAGDDVLKRLNARFRPMTDENEKDTIRLTTHNRMADEINARNLMELKGATVTYRAEVTGKFPDSSFPANPDLTLKPGARVMFIKNDTGASRRYYNGLIGTVSELGTDSVTVIPDDKALLPIEAERVVWENTSYSVDEETKEISQRVEGRFSQIPLRLAWAITIHKSQGLTFERAIIDACHSFAPGQLYVALSRCRSLEGMVLGSPLHRESVIVDPLVNGFIEETQRNMPDDAMVDHMRDEYYRALLAELFNFRPFVNAFADFRHAVEEFVAPMHPELYRRYKDATESLRDKIDSVGQRFIGLYATRPVNSESVATDEAFMEKIRNGCRYFLEQLSPLLDLLNETPLSLDNAMMQKRLDNAADTLILETAIKKTILTGLLTDTFTPETYMKYKAHGVLAASETSWKAQEQKKAKKTKKEIKKKEIKEKKPKGYSQRESLRMWREGKGIEEIASMRDLKPATIAGHLMEMAMLGEIEYSALVPPAVDERIRIICGQAEAEGPDDVYVRIKEMMASAGMPSYLYSIHRRFHAPS